LAVDVDGEAQLIDRLLEEALAVPLGGDVAPGVVRSRLDGGGLSAREEVEGHDAAMATQGSGRNESGLLGGLDVDGLDLVVGAEEGPVGTAVDDHASLLGESGELGLGQTEARIV
jgi:hypothetical protein